MRGTTYPKDLFWSISNNSWPFMVTFGHSDAQWMKLWRTLQNIRLESIFLEEFSLIWQWCKQDIRQNEEIILNKASPIVEMFILPMFFYPAPLRTRNDGVNWSKRIGNETERTFLKPSSNISKSRNNIPVEREIRQPVEQHQGGHFEG